MWNEKKPWWQKPKGDPRKAVDRQYAKNWCVVKVMASAEYIGGRLTITSLTYKPCAKLNAPKYYNENMQLESSIAVDNLTKHEAHCVAKGLNFFESE